MDCLYSAYGLTILAAILAAVAGFLNIVTESVQTEAEFANAKVSEKEGVKGLFDNLDGPRKGLASVARVCHAAFLVGCLVAIYVARSQNLGFRLTATVTLNLLLLILTLVLWYMYKSKLQDDYDAETELPGISMKSELKFSTAYWVLIAALPVVLATAVVSYSGKCL